MQIDIVIVNYHSADHIAQCLAALGSWQAGTAWLVDNSCDAEQARALHALAQASPNVRVLVASENLGFARGCNLAFAQSKADFLLLLNPDALVTGAAVLQLAQTMRLKADLGALSPTIYWNRQRTFVTPPTMAQNPWAECVRVASQANAFVSKWLARRHLEAMRRIANADTLQRVEFLSGAVLMLRREAVLDAAKRIQASESHKVPDGPLLFDPAYFMFFEDSDLSMRLRQAGWELAVLPSAQAVHEYRQKAFKAGLMQQSRHTYFRTRFALFYSFTRRLSWMDSLATRIGVRGNAPDLGDFAQAGDFENATQGDGVIAFSPSELMVPAIFRPAGFSCTPFTAHEWELLEPGRYCAHLRDTSGRHYWVRWTLVKS